jgi:succinate dehydrogenase hydrophobic anchor subunit
MTPSTDAATDVDQVDGAETDADHGAADAGHGDPDRDRDAAADEPRDEQPWSWHLTRVTGLFLAVLLPIHFVAVMIVNDVGATTAVTMDQRLHNITWRSIEWITLLLAVAHSFLALRPLIADSNLRAPVREAGVVAVGVVAVLLAVAGSLVLLPNR